MPITIPILNDPDNPLVSILIHNYNYGKYLEECLESAFSQTYENIEVIFSDNASTDQSWDIALRYVKKYPGRMTVTRNRVNFGSDANVRNCTMNTRGKYFVQLCSDDILLPGFVEQCVRVFKAHRNVAYVMVHRSIINNRGEIEHEPPFYNKSCIISGEDQAAVYMMAAVNPSISQIMYDRLIAFTNNTLIKSIASLWYINRLNDFHLCMHHSMAYIKDELMGHRLHGGNDSAAASESLIEVIAPYIIKYQFAEIAGIQGMKKVTSRLQPAIDKLAELSLRYSLKFLSKQDEKTALKYYHLGLAIRPEIQNTDTARQLELYWRAEPLEKSRILQSFRQTKNLITRAVSYDPPEGSIPL